MTREELLRFLAAVPAEIRMQQVHHRPQMPAFLDVDLEEVAQVVERRAGMAQQVLLLDRGGLGVSLCHDQAPKLGSELARDLLPHRLTERIAEADGALGDRIGEENAP